MASIQVPSITLNNGMKMPVLGLGTYMATEGLCEQSVKEAIDAGYRHIDTAFIYRNEVEVGNAIRAKIAEGIIRREDVFIVTKLFNSFHDPKLVKMACEESIKNLNLGPIDLYLMHTPMGFHYGGNGFDQDQLEQIDTDGNIIASDFDYVDTWKAMEKLQEQGLVRSLGVSNFNSEQIDRLLKVATIRPVTNQVELSANFNQRKLLDFCKERDIILTSYGPLGRPHKGGLDGIVMALHDPKVQVLVEKYNKTAAQVILRYLIQLGTVPIPKSSNRGRIEENINVFDFELNAADMDVMHSLNMDLRLVKFEKCKDHKYFPFNIEF